MTVGVPIFGITLRSFVVTWGEGVRLLDVLTLDHYRELTDYPNVVTRHRQHARHRRHRRRAAVACYTAIALAMHRWSSGWTRLVDYLVMMPRAMPGLVAGLAMLWLFLFVPFLSPLRSTMVSIWLAYTIVWLAYGMRLVSGTLLQVAPELEEAARTAGASELRVKRDVTVPLIKYGMLAAWLLVFLIFVREYSTGIYLLGPGTEVIGSLMVSLWGTGAVDLVSALSVINIVIIGVALPSPSVLECASMADLVIKNVTLSYGDNEILKGVSLSVGGRDRRPAWPLRQRQDHAAARHCWPGDATSGHDRHRGYRILRSARGVDLPAEKRGLGLVFQSYALWPHRTVFDNVAYGLKLRGVATTEIATRVDKTLRRSGSGISPPVFRTSFQAGSSSASPSPAHSSMSRR